MLLQEVAWDEERMILYPLSHHLAQTSHEWKLSITTRVKDLISWRSHKATYCCSMARKKMAGIMVKTLEPNSEFVDSEALYLWWCNYRSHSVIMIKLSVWTIEHACALESTVLFMRLLNFKLLTQTICFLQGSSFYKASIKCLIHTDWQD